MQSAFAQLHICLLVRHVWLTVASAGGVESCWAVFAADEDPNAAACSTGVLIAIICSTPTVPELLNGADS